MKLNIEYVRGIQARSEQLHSAEQVRQAAQRLAGEIKLDLGERDPLVLCVMNGAVIPAAMLITRMDFPLRLDYVHATRYQGATSGGELNWLSRPRNELRGEDVLVIDDIFDEGITLELIVDDCRKQGAGNVHSAVMVEKRRQRSCTYRPDYVGLRVADRYVFGAGMDYKEYLRNVPGIWAVSDKDL